MKVKSIKEFFFSNLSRIKFSLLILSILALALPLPGMIFWTLLGGSWIVSIQEELIAEETSRGRLAFMLFMIAFCAVGLIFSLVGSLG